MGAAVGLIAGVGLLLIWRSFTVPATIRTARRPLRLVSWLEDLTRSAGVSAVRPAGVISLCAIGFVLVGVLVIAVSRAAPVALAFALLAAYAPIAVLRSRARRRRRELAEVWPEAVDHLAPGKGGLQRPPILATLTR